MISGTLRDGYKVIIFKLLEAWDDDDFYSCNDILDKFKGVHDYSDCHGTGEVGDCPTCRELGTTEFHGIVDRIAPPPEMPERIWAGREEMIADEWENWWDTQPTQCCETPFVQALYRRDDTVIPADRVRELVDFACKLINTYVDDNLKDGERKVLEALFPNGLKEEDYDL
jgi:hypothetical protein